MKLYIVSENYIQFLHDIEKKVLLNHFIKHDRKYLCLGIQFGGKEYFIPLSSPDKGDYKPNGEVRKSILPIFRMKAKDGHLLGKLLINNMIPVPPSELEYYDLRQETDIPYRNLVLQELRIIEKNEKTIIRNAKILYFQKTAGLEAGYIDNTVDFKVLERLCDEWIKRIQGN